MLAWQTVGNRICFISFPQTAWRANVKADGLRTTTIPNYVERLIVCIRIHQQCLRYLVARTRFVMLTLFIPA